jgi:hypothetical protein
MYPRHREIESYHRELREQSLDKCLTPMTLWCSLGTMNTMQEL